MTVKPINPRPSSTQTLARRFSTGAMLDLVVLILFALLLPFLPQMPSVIRVPFGLLAALFAPGYALTAAAFPQRATFDVTAWAGLSFGLSIALLPVLALLLNIMPRGLQPGPMLVALTLTILLCCAVATMRRWRELPVERHEYAVRATPLRLTPQVIIGAILGLLVATGIVMGAVFIVATPYLPPNMTEFYALGAEGRSESYAREIVANQAMQLNVGVTNREQATMHYRIELHSGGAQLAQAGPITLAPGATFEQPITYQLAHAGDNQQINIFLYINDTPSRIANCGFGSMWRATP